MFNVNVMSGVRLSRIFLPKMLEKNTGNIIFIVSEQGTFKPKKPQNSQNFCDFLAHRPIPSMLHYAITKAAQTNLTRGLAELCKGTKVRVNCVAPGPTMTEGF